MGTTSIRVPAKEKAIEEWIQRHPSDKYVILDDDWLGLPNQVKTDIRIGLTRTKAEEAITILNQISSYSMP